MDEQFDNHLNNHIREVFGNFEDPTADESWLLLRKKFPAKEKDRPVIWLWLGSAAALLLLLLGIGTWVNLNKVAPKKLAYKPVKIYHQPNQNKAIVTNKQNELVKGRNPADTSANKKTALATTIITTPKTKPSTAVQKQLAIKPGSNGNAISPAQPIAGTKSVKTLMAEKPLEKPAIIANEKPTNPTALKDTPAKNNAVVVIPRSVVKPLPPVYLDKPSPAKEQKANKTVQEDYVSKKVQFGIYAATYFNYAKGSNNQVNIGAGVTSDIRLTNNLRLSTGVSVGQNTLSYTNELPQQAVEQVSVAAVSKVAYGGVKSSALYNNVINYASPSLNNYSAQLVALDIPVNLKYEFNPQKSSSYISVGLSSGTFINETYTSQYNYATPSAYAASISQTHTTTTDNSFGNFYFAKTLNVSFGVGYPLGKNYLVIEPFLKYPLEGMGEQQIRFGAGGINLKFDFLNPKK
jgi:hypothetical protein